MWAVGDRQRAAKERGETRDEKNSRGRLYCRYWTESVCVCSVQLDHLEPHRVIIWINETAWRRCGEAAAEEMRQMDITWHDMWRVEEGVGGG